MNKQELLKELTTSLLATCMQVLLVDFVSFSPENRKLIDDTILKWREMMINTYVQGKDKNKEEIARALNHLMPQLYQSPEQRNKDFMEVFNTVVDMFENILKEEKK